VLPALLNFSLDNLDFFIFNNKDQHDRIASAILKQKNIQLSDFPIYPVKEENLKSFFLSHQQMHDDVNSVLGLPGGDLSEIDFKDDRKVEYWKAQHFLEHYQWTQALKL
jgi:hypothetical protein